MKLYDFQCRHGHVFEAVVRNSDVHALPCRAPGCLFPARRLFPAPKPINWLGDTTTKAVQTGRPDDRSDIPPWVTDTSKLGRREQSYHEWRRERRNKRMDQITREVEREVGDPRPTIYGGAASTVK